MGNPLRTAVLLVSDERSRLVCSLLLRHDGYRVQEARSPNDAIAIIGRFEADLVIADLTPAERANFHRQILEHAPRVYCLFVHERSTLDELKAEIDVHRQRRHESASRN